MKGRARLCPYYFVSGEGDNLRSALGGVLATIVPADKKIVHGMTDAVLAPCSVGKQNGADGDSAPAGGADAKKISNTISLTPGFSPVLADRSSQTVSTVFPALASRRSPASGPCTRPWP